MANFDQCIQSNNFKVMDIKSFKDELTKIDGTSLFEFLGDNEVCVATYDGLQSSSEIDSVEVNYEYDDYLKLIQEHMCPDQKVFINSIGHEKLRYLTADCTIITKDNIIYHDFFAMIGKEFNNGYSVF